MNTGNLQKIGCRKNKTFVQTSWSFQKDSISNCAAILHRFRNSSSSSQIRRYM